MSDDDQKPPQTAPPVSPPPLTYYSRQPQTNVVDELIPSKNGNALLSYYLGLFSIFPVAGLAMGIIAFVSGRRALAAAKLNPDIKGTTHAKVGVGCGLIGFIFNLLIVVPLAILLIYSLMHSHEAGSSQ